MIYLFKHQWKIEINLLKVLHFECNDRMDNHPFKNRPFIEMKVCFYMRWRIERSFTNQLQKSIIVSFTIAIQAH